MKQKHWQVSVFDKTSEIIRDDTFYTTDTEAYLIFELIDEDFTPDSATVTVYNIYGKATINANVGVVDGIVRYEMPEEAIGHPGGWRTQVIFTKDDEDYTTKIIEFDVGGHLLDNKKPAIVDIENWNSFIAHARELIDDWEQLEEIRQADFELAETGRQNTYEQAEEIRNQASNQAVADWEQGADVAFSGKISEFETDGNQAITDFNSTSGEILSTIESNESSRLSSEATRETSETVRLSAETARETNETARISNENARKSAETIRLASEADRVSAENVRAEFYEGFESELNKKANKAQEDWSMLTTLNGWGAGIGDYAKIMKDEFGFVHLKLNLTAGTVGNYTKILEIPTGYRPINGHTFNFGRYSNGNSYLYVTGQGKDLSTAANSGYIQGNVYTSETIWSVYL